MRSLRPRRGLLLAPLLLGAAACDIPTETPQWDTTWVVPADSTVIPVSSFFTSGVAVVEQGTLFDITLPNVSLARTLGEMCGNLCAAANGATVPKPAFTTSFATNIALPTDLVSATIQTGRIDVRLSHNLGFDPVRPSATARGYLVLALTSGGVTLVRDSISGNDTAFPANTPLARGYILREGAVVTGPVVLTVTVGSPAGGAVRIDTSQRLTVETTLGRLAATEARVRVGGSRAIAGPVTTLDLPDLSDRVRGGAFLLDVANPFGATAALNLEFGAGAGTIAKAVQLPAGNSRTRVDFTRDELRALFQAQNPTLRASGTFAIPGDILTVRPSQVLRVKGSAELVISTESDS